MNRSRNLAVLSLAVCLLLGADAAQAGPAPMLELWMGQPPRLVRGLQLAADGIFVLEHQNSIYLALVRETYRAEPGGGFTQLAMESPSAGVFEYHGYDPPISGHVKMSRFLTEIRLLSSSYQHHNLCSGGRCLGLGEVGEPGKPLTVRSSATPTPLP